MKKNIDFKEIYKLPLAVDEYCKIYAYTNNGMMALTFIEEDEEEAQKIVKIINNEIPNDIREDITYDDGNIYFSDKLKFMIRGWGYLTSNSCLGLTNNEAAKVQDEFGMWIVNKLGKHE